MEWGGGVGGGGKGVVTVSVAAVVVESVTGYYSVTITSIYDTAYRDYRLVFLI